jgi:hypothetical protein
MSIRAVDAMLVVAARDVDEARLAAWLGERITAYG